MYRFSKFSKFSGAVNSVQPWLRYPSQRLLSAQAQPAPEVQDPEWESALPYSKIPAPGFFDFASLMGSQDKKFGGTVYEMHRAMRDNFGPIIRLRGYFGSADKVMTFLPDDFEKVFRTEGVWPVRDGFETVEYYRKVLRNDTYKTSTGLLTEQGENWHNIRTNVNPVMMQPKTVQQYITKVDAVTQDFMKIVRELRDDKQETPANFFEWLNRWALESMGVIVLDTRLGVLESENTGEARRIMQLTKESMDLMYHLDFMPSIWRIVKTPKFYKLMRVFDEVNGIVRAKVDEAVALLDKTPNQGNDNQSILQKLLKIDRHTAMVMSLDSLLAGVDTTSTGTSGILYCLAKHPEKQNKLREELRTILPKKDSPLTPENMKNLPYLRACIKETMRYHPTTAGNARCTGKDLVLQGYRIPKGTMIAMGQFLLLRDETQFPRPNEFLPERWLSSDDSGCPHGKTAHPFVYMPFGFGARTCIGRRLANLEMESITARMVRNFDIRWNYEDMKIKITLLNIPESDLKYQLKEIDD